MPKGTSLHVLYFNIQVSRRNLVGHSSSPSAPSEALGLLSKVRACLRCPQQLKLTPKHYNLDSNVVIESSKPPDENHLTSAVVLTSYYQP